MKYGICKICEKRKLLTKHSPIGSHLPPYEYLCSECHDIHHEAVSKRKNTRTQKGNLKNAKGTNRRKNK